MFLHVNWKLELILKNILNNSRYLRSLQRMLGRIKPHPETDTPFIQLRQRDDSRPVYSF